MQSIQYIGRSRSHRITARDRLNPVDIANDQLVCTLIEKDAKRVQKQTSLHLFNFLTSQHIDQHITKRSEGGETEEGEGIRD